MKLHSVDSVFHELRWAGRSLRRSPSFAATAVVTLAIGIGAATCIFTVVNAVLLRPLPYDAPDRLVVVQHALPGLKMEAVGRLTLGMFFTYGRLAKHLDGIAAYQTVSVNVGDGRSGGPVERARAGHVSANTFATLGVAPHVGRGFSTAEDRPGGPAAAVISERLWRRAFGADRAVLGRTVTVDGTEHPIVGVMPATFHFPEAGTDVWLPLRADRLTQFSGGFDQQAIARLRPGVERSVAERDLQSLVPRVAESYPFFAPGLPTTAMHEQARPAVRLLGLRDSLVGEFASVLWIVAGAVGVILLAACSNVLNLLLVRIDDRQKELAVRTALGGGRARLLGHFLAEMGVVSGIGAAIGLAAGLAGTGLFTRFAPRDIPRLPEVRFGLEAILFAIVVATTIAVACALIGMLRFASSDMGTLLKDGGRGTASRGRQRLRALLVTAQVALAVVLLASSGVLARSFMRVRTIDAGFDVTNTMAMWLSVPSVQYRTADQVARYYAAVVDSVAAVPGVLSAGAATKLPLDYDGIVISPVWPETGPLAKASVPPLTLLTASTAGYFAALRIPVLAGRSFSRDLRGAPPEAIVNASMANTLFGDRSGERAVGRRLRLRPGGTPGDLLYTVVGVVRDVRDTSLLAGPPNVVYTAMQRNGDTTHAGVSRTMGIVIRTSANPLGSTPAFREVVRRLDSAIPPYKIGSLQDVVDRSVVRLSFTLLALGAGALVTLTLCLVGLYGVISYVVSLRTREIGIRLALGARPLTIEALVVRKAVVLALLGIAGGMIVYFVSARVLRTLVFGVAPTDPATLASVAVVLTAITTTASWVAARRARSIDPVEALRRG